MGNLIKIENITYKYPKSDEVVLQNLTLNIKEHEFVTILGQNGSGKSTLAKAISGLLTPNSGSITIDGISIMSVSKKDKWSLRERVGMVFQNPVNQIVGQTVEEDIAFALENRGLAPSFIRESVLETMEKLQIKELRFSNPKSLSGGQIQKVAIAGVLAIKPKVIILDESTSMLDPVSKKEILGVVQKLNQVEGTTIINITHQIEDSLYSDRVVLLHKGNILLDGKPAEVLTNTKGLAKAGFHCPWIVEVANDLREIGIPLRNDIITIKELVNELWRLH